MSYLLPSFIQKRILRYALSRLELVETRDLDLDNLDIAWGKRSTIELRDVGVSASKLSALIQLPPGVILTKARISLLRITIPADLYSSGIVVDIRNVHVHVDTEVDNAKADRHKAQFAQSRRQPPGTLPTSSGHPRYRYDDDAQAEALPSTIELAQSFIQAEPPQERAEMKAAVADSQSIDQSEVLSESIEDTSALGVGGGISLPGFLASFLKGVGDRIQLNIKDIHISLNTRVEIPPEALDPQEHSVRWENLTIRLSVESIDIDGITDHVSVRESTARTTENKRENEQSDSRSQRVVRRIALRNVQGSLISESSLFANLSRISVPTSPYTTQSSKASTGGKSSSNSNSVPSSPLSLKQRSGSASKMEVGKRSLVPAVGSIKAGSPGRIGGTADYVQSTTADEYGSESDGQSQCHDSVFTGSFYSDLDDSNYRSQNRRDLAPGDYRGRPDPSQGDEVRSKPRNPFQEVLIAPSSKSSSSPDIGSPRYGGYADNAIENLAESKIYSHEEAQSMYMSAMSQRSRQDDTGQRNMPGDWDSSSSEDETFVTGANATTQSLIEKAQSESHTLDSPDSSTHSSSEPRDSPVLQQQNESPKTSSSAISETVAGGPAAANLSTSEQGSSEKSASNSDLSDTGLFIVKRFMLIDLINIEIPQDDGRPADVSPPSVLSHHSDTARVSSSCSIEPQQISSTEHSQSLAAVNLIPSSSSRIGSDKASPKPPTSVQLEDVSIQGDIGLTKLTIMIVQRLMELVKQESQVEKGADTAANASDRTEIAIGRISWKFLDLIKGVTLSESQTKNFEAQATEMSDDTDVLLKASVRDLKICMERDAHTMALTSSIKKMTFGYATENILAFDSGLRLRESNRDMLGPIDNDMNLKVSHSVERTHIELTTLPVHVHLDLRRLDETFNWFGGFSGILGLGSSMISTVTVMEPKSKPSATTKRRGVHFESTKPDTQQPGASPQPKITARLGGIILDLEGKSAAFKLETSAVKLVSRAEGIGLSVDRLNISGPYIASQSREPSISVKLHGLRAEYLSNPKEIDLTRLLALLCPSKDNYDQDDDILVDTLLRQRQQGAVVRMNVDRLDAHVHDIADLEQLPALGEDLKKLSTVTKYLPEDDRPGIMTLVLVRSSAFELKTGHDLGNFQVYLKSTEAAHISLPSLVAFSVGTVEMRRNNVEELIGEPASARSDSEISSPMIMTRFVGNELKPTVKLKLFCVRAEYHLATIIAALGLSEEASSERIVSDLVSSIATVTALPNLGRSSKHHSAEMSSRTDDSKLGTPPLGLDLVLRDVVIGLNPQDSAARGIIVLSQAHVILAPSKHDVLNVTLEIDKAAFLAINDVDSISNHPGIPSVPASATLQKRLLGLGYVGLSEMSAAKMNIDMLQSGSAAGKSIDVELRDALIVLESCADSTQTIQLILNGLKPPSRPEKEPKYRTEVMPVEDMLASFSGDAFATQQPGNDDNYDSADEMDDDPDEERPQDLEFVSSFYGADSLSEDESMSDSVLEGSLDSLSNEPPMSNRKEDNETIAMDHTQIIADDSTLEFREDHFGHNSIIGGTAHRWDTKRNTYELADDSRLRASPFRLRVRGVHVIWNLFDGYDWQSTRDTIGQAVAAVEDKAAERRSKRNKRRSLNVDEEEESVIGDFLFNSIYIGISAKHDPKDLTRQINRNIDDLVSETESYATSAGSSSPSRQSGGPRAHKRQLRLLRSKSHKLTFEIKGFSVDMVVFPEGSGETQSSIDFRVQDLEIFDHLPTSTWKKFATYMHDAGERESGSSMIHLEILNVKPVPDLAASEIILKATFLPLRLHVDQDALDFMTRFFEFKDDSIAPTTSKSEPPFLQRVEVKSIRVKLDFKPKRVDYAGLRSGHTTEFMNFFILDQANMVLRRVIIHGVSGFDKLGKMLNDIWSPDVRNNQLPSVLAGLTPVRSLANVGGGVRDLVVVPIREYRKNGRVVRSIQKGALAFAKTTTSELAKLGAKLAINTQTVLQGAQDFLEPDQHNADVSTGWEDAEIDDEEKKQISLYSDQPVGVMQGLRGGYASLERDLLMAKDAIIAIPGEVMDSGSAGGAARAILRGAPTVILRPALGVSKAVGQTLMGATNSLDPANRRRLDDKYKRH